MRCADRRSLSVSAVAGASGGDVVRHFCGVMNRPDVFQEYIAISPSLWWDGQALVKASPPFFAARKDLLSDLYLTMGSEGQEMLGGAWKLSALLEENKIPDLRWQFKRSPDEDHGTSPYLGI
jgi:predicted alpha/beta superfamily hydrolase